MDIEGSVVMVTGANRGFGHALVEALLEAGAAKVYAGARDPSTVVPSAASPVRLDITDAAQVADAAGALSDVTIVINNAGISTGTSLLAADGMEHIRREMDTNFFGTLAVTRAFAPVLRANGGGAIVNVLSVLSWLAMPGTGAYCAAKAAALSLTNSIREELAPDGIQVLAVHVGYMDTDMTARVNAPKSTPADVAAQVVDALRAGRSEVLADAISTNVRGALSGELGLLYPSAVDPSEDATR